ncbi:hypothetical protein GGI13_003727 [Coemansia sp. RSA 455]|nr:hypothetical protein GGI13_003727 [Coemansia sp. RSA 455]
MLTSYLKETVSFRYWDMMDETYIMNAVKEKCCFVSSDFYRDLDAACGCIGGRSGKNSLGLEYVLPDFTNSKCGYIKGQGGEAEQQAMDTEAQVLPLCNERFAIPEALFHPVDVGLEQGGIHQAVVQAVMACNENLRGVLMANILLVGGTAALPGLQQRLQSEVQAMSPYRVCISIPEDPATGAWHGGRMLTQGQTVPEEASYTPATVAEWRLTRAQYQEKVWNAFTGQELVSLPHNHIVKSADFANNDVTVITGSQDKSVRIFDITRPDQPSTAVAHSAPVRSVKWSRHKNVVVSAGDDKRINILDLRAPTAVKTLEIGDNISNISLTSDGRILSCASGKRIIVWDVDAFKVVKDIAMDYEVSVAAVNPQRTRIVTGGKSDLLIRSCEFESGKELEVHKGHHGPVHDACFSPDGEVYATGSEDGTVRLWQSNPGSAYGLWQLRKI